MSGLELNIEFIGLEQAIKELEGLAERLNTEMPALFRSLGDALVANVKNRIVTSDGGSWAPASKWLKAKSGQSKVLLGAEKFVRARVTKNSLQIVGKGGKWTLTQHHEGFINQKDDASEPHDDQGRVILKIKDAGPLNLYQEHRQRRKGPPVARSTTFAFVPKVAGRTPARKIWPTQGEVEGIGQPIASRWLEKIVGEMQK